MNAPSTYSRIREQDLHLFNEGTHRRLYESLGAHAGERDGVSGTVFAVWAPSAKAVSVVGDFNGWDAEKHTLAPRDQSGIWEGFIEGIAKGTLYKYSLELSDGKRIEKADPVGILHECPPKTASIVWDLEFEWSDSSWMDNRADHNSRSAPMSIYEVHLGSWRRVADEGNRSLGYRELAPLLAEHCKTLGFTHVEFLPVMEHPFGGSWGYQVTGFFAPTHRHGKPQDLMFLIDYLHNEGIGVILDWVPAHFPTDAHGPGDFDGTHLYEHADPRQGFHPDWRSYIFNYSRHEVRSFLLSAALFWFDAYHIDGIRVDGVASMLYLDYSREPGEWIPNAQGGRENTAAIQFLRELNEAVYSDYPSAQTIAEESTAWPMVSRPTFVGGLGFGFKWDMGWMHDTLRYLERDPIHRRYHHNEITFRSLYAFQESFVLPLSHDEVVHGKGSLINKMPGDRWQKFANLKLLLAHMYSQPGKKLLFMGSEIAQWREWSHESSLDWYLLDDPSHKGVHNLVGDLNRLYRDQPALHQLDTQSEGFEWIDGSDSDHCVIAFLRLGEQGKDAVPILAIFNFTPVIRYDYRVGVPEAGAWRELFNSDAEHYGGSGVGNLGSVDAQEEPCHGRPYSLNLVLPPLGALFLCPAR